MNLVTLESPRAHGGLCDFRQPKVHERTDRHPTRVGKSSRLARGQRLCKEPTNLLSRASVHDLPTTTRKRNGGRPATPERVDGAFIVTPLSRHVLRYPRRNSARSTGAVLSDIQSARARRGTRTQRPIRTTGSSALAIISKAFVLPIPSSRDTSRLSRSNLSSSGGSGCDAGSPEPPPRRREYTRGGWIGRRGRVMAEAECDRIEKRSWS